jgi:hypothetical protein
VAPSAEVPAEVPAEGKATDGYDMGEPPYGVNNDVQMEDILNEGPPQGAANEDNSLESILARNTDPAQEQTPVEEFVDYGVPDPEDSEKTAEVSEPVPEADQGPQEVPPEAVTGTPGQPNTITLKEGELPVLKKSDNPGFDPQQVQSPKVDEDNEGGVVASKTTGPTMSQASNEGRRPEDEGHQIKPAPNMTADSVANKFEMTGFQVQYETGKVLQSVEIRDYFDDLETAQASVNGSKYLMPMPNGFKIANITGGMPVLSFDERQMYEYQAGKWKRT